MITPKAILVVGTNGLERVHVLHLKGEAAQAARFYERLVPAISELERRAKEAIHHGKPGTEVADRD